MAPLDGRVVIVTRERAGELASLLTDEGARVIHLPLISTGPAADGGKALDAALGRLDRYKWLVVTSSTGARAVVEAFVAGAPERRPLVACIGEATAAVVRDRGVEPDLVPSSAHLEALASRFPAGAGRVLLARADIADPRLVAALERKGWTVDDVAAYATVERAPNPEQRSLVDGAEIVTFASASAVRSWVAAFGRPAHLAVVSIGPSTTSEASRLGVAVTATASVQSVGGLVESVRSVAERWVAS